MKVKPLNGYVLIKPADAEKKTASGLYIPENAMERKAIGEILSVGGATISIDGGVLESPVKVGERVYYKKWGGDDIEVDGKDLKLVKFEDLIAVLEDKNGE